MPAIPLGFETDFDGWRKAARVRVLKDVKLAPSAILHRDCHSAGIFKSGAAEVEEVALWPSRNSARIERLEPWWNHKFLLPDPSKNDK